MSKPKEGTAVPHLHHSYKPSFWLESNF